MMRALFVVVVLSCFASEALANGLYVTERGTRALGRAGAFVAGASGVDAVGHNPAGLSGSGVLGELTLPMVRADYRRQLAIRDADGNTQNVYSPTVQGTSELIPFPTLVAAFTPDDGKLTVAFGLITPTFALMSFPAKVDGMPSPARYTLSGFTDSRLVQAGAWLSYRPHPKISFGLGTHALIGTFRSTIAFTLSPPDRLLAAPEDPDYDAVGRINVGPMIAPSGSAGVLVTPAPWLKLGLAGELPIWLDSDATFDVRLPTSAVFDTVKVDGRRAHVSMRLPAILRAGIEVHPTDRLAVELAYVREFWSMHDQITVHPEGIRVRGIPGGPDSFALPAIRIPRGYRDTNAIRLGLEQAFELFARTGSLRAGIAYEPSAVPPGYLSLSSLDARKVLVTCGASLAVTRKLRLDVTYGHVFMQGTTVSPDEAKLTRINPLAGNAPPEYVNGGRYRLAADVLSGAFAYSFD